MLSHVMMAERYWFLSGRYQDSYQSFSWIGGHPGFCFSGIGFMTQLVSQLNPMAVYAEGIDASDYVKNLVPVIRDVLSDIGDLLDVGAGAGQLGSALHTHCRHWVAIEPDPYMCNRLSSCLRCTRVISGGWGDVHHLIGRSFDTVLAANMIAPQVDAVNFLERCRFWTRDAIVWVVPCQQGPKQFCLSGCLPAEWHGENGRSGYEQVIEQLPAADCPDYTLSVDWTFTYQTEDIGGVAEHMAARLGWTDKDTRRDDLYDHLYRSAKPSDIGGYQLEVPKQSAILIWTGQ